MVKVASTSSGSSASCAIFATAGMSSTSRPGLPSVSPKSRRVLRPDRPSSILEIPGIDERRLDAEALQRVAEQVVRAAVERARGDDVAARAHQRGDREVQRRLARSGGDGADAAFERRDALFEHRDRGVGDARVDVPRALHVEERRGVLGVAEDVRGGLVDRHRAAAGRRVGRLAGVQRQRVKAGVLRRRQDSVQVLARGPRVGLEGALGLLLLRGLLLPVAVEHLVHQRGDLARPRPCRTGARGSRRRPRSCSGAAPRGSRCAVGPTNSSFDSCSPFSW